MIHVWFDGACEPKNPGGYATWGFHVAGDTWGEGYGCAGDGPLMSSNVSEYAGLIGAMEWLIQNEYSHETIVVHGDSALVIKQMNGRWKPRPPKPGEKKLYLPFHARAKELLPRFRDIRFQWIPRGENRRADELSRKWLDENKVRLSWRSEKALRKQQDGHRAASR